MKKTIFSGSGVALVTPLGADGINYDSFGRLIDFQIECGTDALIVCGTTGEAPTLDDGEHLDAIEFAAERANGRVPVIAGTGSNNTDHAIMMSKEAAKRGADGLLWVSPYYNKATQRGLVKHYQALAGATDLPAILYNVPSRTGVDILPATIKELSAVDTIVAVKEATGNVARAAQIIAECGDDIDVYSGNDDITVPLMSIGAKGVISVLANIMPAETSEMCRFCLEGDFASAAQMQLGFDELVRALFCEVNPIPVKTALNLMGFDVGELRLPLCEMSDEHLEFLKGAMRKHGIEI